MYFAWECCVLSGRGLSVGLITRPEECDRGTSTTRRPWPKDCWTVKGKKVNLSLMPPWRRIRGEEVQLQPFLISASDGVVYLKHRPVYPPRNNPGTRWTEGWVVPEAVWKFRRIKSHIISKSTPTPPPKKNPRVNTDIGQDNNRFCSRLYSNVYAFIMSCMLHVPRRDISAEAEAWVMGKLHVEVGHITWKLYVIVIYTHTHTHARNWIPLQLSHWVNQCTLCRTVCIEIYALNFFFFFHIYARPTTRERISVHFLTRRAPAWRSAK